MQFYPWDVTLWRWYLLTQQIISAWIFSLTSAHVRISSAFHHGRATDSTWFWASYLFSWVHMSLENNPVLEHLRNCSGTKSLFSRQIIWFHSLFLEAAFMAWFGNKAPPCAALSRLCQTLSLEETCSRTLQVIWQNLKNSLIFCSPTHHNLFWNQAQEINSGEALLNYYLSKERTCFNQTDICTFFFKKIA